MFGCPPEYESFIPDAMRSVQRERKVGFQGGSATMVIELSSITRITDIILYV